MKGLSLRRAALACSELTEPEILGWLEGESGAVRAWRIRRHLSRCWTCRSRVAIFDEALRRVQKELGRPATQDRREIEVARWRFWQSVRGRDLGDPSAKPVRNISVIASRAFMILAATLIPMAIGTVFLSPKRVQPPAASSATRDAIAALRQVEVAGFATSIRQENYEVEITDGSNARLRRNWKRWVAPRKGLYKAVWSGKKGETPKVLFHRDSKQNAGAATDLATFQSNGLADAMLTTFSGRVGIEAAVVEWIGRQLWCPISLAQEMADFRSRTGAVLHLLRTSEGIQIVAEQRVGDAQVSMLLEADSQSSPPKLLRITWRRGAETRIVRISRTNEINYADFKLVAANFAYADLPVRKKVVRPALPPSVDRTIPSQELTGVRVDVLQVLHNLGLCMQDIVQVKATSQIVEVAGMVADETTRENLRRALDALPHRELIGIKLQAPTGIRNFAKHTEGPRRRPEPDTPAPIEDWFRQYGRSGHGMTERKLFDLMNESVNSSERFSAQWAELGALANDFPAASRTLLTAEAREKLLGIEKSHFLEARANLARMRTALTTLIPEAAATARAPVDRIGAFEQSWQNYILSSRQAGLELADQMIKLFSSHARSTKLTTPVTETQISHLAAELAASLSLADSMETKLETEIATCRTQSAKARSFEALK